MNMSTTGTQLRETLEGQADDAPPANLFSAAADDKAARVAMVQQWLACPRWRRWSSAWFAMAARLSVEEVEQIRRSNP